MHGPRAVRLGVAGTVPVDTSAPLVMNNRMIPTAFSRPATTPLQALPAAVASSLSAITSLPLWSKLLAACALPPCLGFWKQEYGVSYAYGSSVALGAYWIYSHHGKSSKAACWHAGALIFYGVRLCLFLAARQRISQRIRDGMERIEARAQERGPRWKRTPFLVVCGCLYYGLTAPLLLTTPLLAGGGAPSQEWTMRLLHGLIATSWFGFVFAAAGDLHKTLTKSIRKNEHHLVTGGMFRAIRHPNYTGEIVGWTANAAAAVVAAVAGASALLPKAQVITYAVASVLAAVGMDFILLRATQGLEQRQEEAHGDTKEYQQWKEKSWAGFSFPMQAEVKEEAGSQVIKPALEFNDMDESTGSGI